jgi:RNA polymerase sigma factor (sigma-70 family)
MATRSIASFLQHLRYTLRLHEDTPNDAQLLKQFIEHRDQSAFATIVRRHGLMVLGVCRRLVHDQHDAEDAFQATFLILVRKAASIAKRELLANWLYGVAYNTALKARAASMKRRAKEKQVTEMPDLAAGAPALENEELLALLDQELSRLPEKYRLPIILCDLEGKSRKQAAQLLGCPEGSLSSRLARAKARLSRRLARHGLAVSGGSLAAALAQQRASASVSPSVFSSTIRSAATMAAGKAAVSGVSPQVAALMEGVLKTMLLSKISAGAICLVVCLAVFGASLALYQRAAAQTQTTEKAGRRTTQSDERAPKEPEAPTEDDLRRDADALQGKWSVEAMIVEGSVVPADILKAVVVEFKGDKVTFNPDIGVDATQAGKVKFNLCDNPNPNQFKLRGPNPGLIEFTSTDPHEKNKPSTCNYQLNGVTLVIFDGKQSDEKTPVEFNAKALHQNLLVMKRLAKAGLKSVNGSPIENASTIEKNAELKEAVQQYSKEEGREKRGPRFFALAMLLNPGAYDPAPTIAEEVAFMLLGEPDFVCELEIVQADRKGVDKTIKYIYAVANSNDQTIPKEWKIPASETIEVSVTVRDGNVVGTGWNSYSEKEEHPLYRKYKKP